MVALRSTSLLHTAIVMGFITSPVLAQPVPSPRVFANPPALPDSSRAGQLAPNLLSSMNNLKRAEPGPRAHAGEDRRYDLTIKYIDGTLYDPSTRTEQKVSLRGYVSTLGTPGSSASFIAPLINATPGDTVRITLHNDLPAEPDCGAANTPPDDPHCFNRTNLHSHGLWVSPTGNSDNVLLSIEPGVSFQYEYNIPADHPAGTFWYHPHRHGATAVQTGSGMAGALVIHGDRKPTPEVNGDLDTLLTTPAGTPFTDRTLVFVQIPYACHFAKNGFTDWKCGPGETGKVEAINQFGPGEWSQSGRWTTIKGLVLPTFEGIEAGVPER